MQVVALVAVIWATVPAGRKEADHQCSRALVGKPWARLMSNAEAAEVAQGSCLLESIEMLEAARMVVGWKKKKLRAFASYVEKPTE